VVWKQLDGGLFDLYEIVPGFLLSLLAIWIADRTDPAPRAGLEAEFRRTLDLPV
jgi:sodium/proline symporter